MKRFSTPIPEDVRIGMTVCPPPMYGKDAQLLPYPQPMLQKYVDMAAAKQHTVVYIDEELDVFAVPGTRTRYHMTIRCLSCHADLELIMLAARHMGLVSEYRYTSEFRDGIDPALEAAFIDLTYDVARIASPDGGRHKTLLDADTEGEIPVVIDYWLRRKIWTELFMAAGYRTVWGDRVWNVKRRQL